MRRPRLTAWGLAAGLSAGMLALVSATTNFGLKRLQADDLPVLSFEGPEAVWDLDASKARALLLREPLAARAFSRLGQVSALKGEAAEADVLMEAAARRSLRDAPSQTWILVRALERGDDVAAVTAFDVLMRRRPDLFDILSPIIIHALDQRSAARAAMADRLALAPTWRTRFLAAYSRTAANPQNAHALLQALRASAVPPIDAEMRGYIDRLLRERAYVAAYVAWIQHQAPGGVEPAMADGGIAGGDFEAESGLPPFGWTFSAGDGAAAQRGQAADGAGWVLQARAAGGLSRRTLAEQMLVLAPGAYHLSGRAMVRTGDPEGRFVWSLRCVEGVELASIAEGDASPGRWSVFAADVRIPTAGCPAQKLMLQARPGVSLALTEVDYDQLVVVRKGR